MGNEIATSKRDSEPIVTREKAKTFIAMLNQHKIGFSALANEGLNPDMLKDLYRELGIPIPATHPPAAENIGLLKTSAPVLPQKPASFPNLPTKEVIQPEAPSDSKAKSSTDSSAAAGNRAAAAKPASQPGDRQEYIARLMAARSAKQNANSKPSEAPRQPAAATTAPKTIPTGPRAATVSQALHSKVNVSAQLANKSSQQAKLTDAERQSKEEAARHAAEKKRLQTELARKRLEMLAAARARKSAEDAKAQQEAQKAEIQTSAIIAARSPKSDTSFYDDESGIEARPSGANDRHASATSGGSSSDPFASAGEGTSIEKDRRVSQRDSGQEAAGPIPGLTLSGNQSSDTSPLTATQTFSHIGTASGRKRPVAADFDMEVPPQSQQPKRPFGQPRLEHDQERVVIEVSDDESDASAMDIDDDEDDMPQETVKPPSKIVIARQSSFKDLPPLTNFPPRPALTRVSSLPRSALNTPSGMNTPSGGAGTHMLPAKEKEILELKRRIAEMELKAAQKRRINTPNASKATTPPISMSVESASDAVAPQIPLSSPQIVIEQSQVFITPVQNMTKKRLSSLPDGTVSAGSESPVEWRRRRRAEIQTGLPVLDAALASSKARMEELRKEIAALEANSKKQLEDKEKLIQELESLGIDTDGIPDEELQAKRDENVHRLEQQIEQHVVAEEGKRNGN
jgi:hypothetical protein